MDDRRWVSRMVMAIGVAVVLAGLVALVVAAFWWSPSPATPSAAAAASHQTQLRLSRSELHRLRVPIALGAAATLFVVVQAVVDRRDPRLWRAPERTDDETVPFRD